MGSVVWMAACQVSSFTPLEDSGPTTDVHGSGLEPDSGERDTGERVVEEVKDEVDAVVDEETPGVVSGFRSQLAAHCVEPGLTTESMSGRRRMSDTREDRAPVHAGSLDPGRGPQERFRSRFLSKEPAGPSPPTPLPPWERGKGDLIAIPDAVRGYPSPIRESRWLIADG